MQQLITAFPSLYLNSFSTPFTSLQTHASQFNSFPTNFLAASYGGPFLNTPSSFYSPLFSRPSYLNNPLFNFFAETPYSISTNRLKQVPLIVVPKDQINMILTGQVKGVISNKKKSMVTVKTQKNRLVQCTPAVRVVLEQPIVVTAERTQVLFPAEMSVLYQHSPYPINVGAVIAPVESDTVVSEDSPLSINVVYAIPAEVDKDPNEIDIEADVQLNKPVNTEGGVATLGGESSDNKPPKNDYVNRDKDVKVDPEKQAVVVDSPSNNGAGSETTTVNVENFPDGDGVGKPEPVVTDEDDELGNIIKATSTSSYIYTGRSK